MTGPDAAPRNAPCPCGSGRRYKACHGAIGGEGALSLEATLRAALAAHQAGRIDDAAALYDRAIALAPAHFDALHMRGVIELQRGRHERAVELIGRAALLRPDVAEASHNLRLARAALDQRQRGERYRRWIAAVERPRVAARAPLRARAAGRADAPRFAVVVPTWQTPEAQLRACLDSVLAQEWPHWELCIADDASTLPHVRRVLEDYAARDARLRIAFRASNGRIAEASNTALALVTAPYVALLDHDDVLPPHALAEVAIELLAHPAAAIVYSDEDKLDERGERDEPYLKPDWNPALVLAQNYVSHLGVYRTALVREVGGFRRGVDGAQDWDLLLRCAERVRAADIRHVPHVLYHWRASEASTARSMENKAYAVAAQERVVRDACARRGLAVALGRAVHPAFLQVDPVLARPPGVSLVLLDGPGGDAQAWVEAAGVQWLHAACVEAAPVVLDGAARALGRGTARALNAAVAAATGEVVVIADTRFRPPEARAFGVWFAHAVQPGNGPVGALVVDALGDIAGGWQVLDPVHVALTACFGDSAGGWGMAGRGILVQNVAAVRADAMAVRREAWLRLGGLDESLEARWHDVDFCLRARAEGLPAVWHPGVRLAATSMSVEASSGIAPGDAADAARMRARWASALAHDPAYPDDLARGGRWFDFA